MRKSLVVGSLVASLGLSACGVSTSINHSVASLGSASDVQIHLAASFTGAGSARAASILKRVSLEIRLSNPTGAALSASAGKANAESIVYVGGKSLADIRSVAGNSYVILDLSSLSSLPGINFTTTQLQLVQAIVSKHWFELPKSLLASVMPANAANEAKATKDQAIERTIIDEIVKVIDSSKYTTLSSGGYSETGTIQSIVNAVAPTIDSLTHSSFAARQVKGHYTLTLTNAGSTATGGSISITAPNGNKGNATATLNATVTHDGYSVIAPKGAIVLTPTLIKQLESGSF